MTPSGQHVAVDATEYMQLKRVLACFDQLRLAEGSYEQEQASTQELSASLKESQKTLLELLEEIRAEENEENAGELIRRLNNISGDVVRRLEKRTAASSKQSATKRTVTKLDEALHKRLDELRDPDLYALGDKYGPDAWKKIRLEDLSPEHAQQLATSGWPTVGMYLESRKECVPNAVNSGFVPEEDMEKMDAAVYRYLSLHKIEHHWPLKQVPNGGQLTLEQIGGSDDKDAPETFAESSPAEDETADSSAGEGARVIGHDRAAQIAQIRGYRIDTYKRGTQDLAQAKVAATQVFDDLSTDDETPGAFVIEREDGLFQPAVFFAPPSTA